MYPAAPINGNTAPGTSSGQAIAIDGPPGRPASCPARMSTEWTELTLMQILAGNTAMYVFAAGRGACVPGAGRAVRKLVAAAGRDPGRADVPAVLVAGVPCARMDINIFTQIGFVVLVGLASKNAILIVEFAKQLREAGQPVARPRWRPAGCGCGRS